MSSRLGPPCRPSHLGQCHPFPALAHVWTSNAIPLPARANVWTSNAIPFPALALRPKLQGQCMDFHFRSIPRSGPWAKASGPMCGFPLPSLQWMNFQCSIETASEIPYIQPNLPQIHNPLTPVYNCSQFPQIPKFI